MVRYGWGLEKKESVLKVLSRGRRLKLSILLHWRPRSSIFFILNFKRTPSRKEHKSLFSGLSEIHWLCLVKVTALHSFHQSTMLLVTHWLPTVSLLRKVNFLKLSCWEPSYAVKGDSKLLYSIIDKIPVGTGNAIESTWPDKVNFYLSRWKWFQVSVFSCDGVPLKFNIYKISRSPV